MLTYKISDLYRFEFWASWLPEQEDDYQLYVVSRKDELFE